MRVPRTAVVYACMAVAACIATIFVLDVGGYDETAINLEDAKEEVAPASTMEKCKFYMDALEEQHDRFWKDAKDRLNEGVTHSIQTDFTAKMNDINARLTVHGCHPLADDKPDCEQLRDLRRGVAQAVKDQVKVLLAKDTTFQQELQSIDTSTEDLKAQLLQLNCGTILASVAEAVPDKAVSTHMTGAPKSTDEQGTQNEVEKLQSELQNEKTDLAATKKHVEQQEQRTAHIIQEANSELSQRKGEISQRQAKIEAIKKKIALAQWAKNQRDALLHGKPIPPNTAAQYSGDTSPSSQLEQSIGDMFEHDFRTAGASAHDATLLQLGAVPAPSEAADFEKAFDSVGKGEPLRAPKGEASEDGADEHPIANTAEATANAVDAVQEEVRAAARKAARIAAEQAVAKGLDAAATKAFVLAAARGAAKKSAEESHSAFEKAMQNEPTPAMLAARRKMVGAKELAAKSSADKAEEQEKDIADSSTSASETADDSSRAHLKQAAQSAVKEVKTNITTVQDQVSAAESKAVKAEASAWHGDVITAGTTEDVLNEIHTFQKANPGMAMPKAAQKWEEQQIVKLKKRFSDHYTKSLSLDPSTKTGKLQALHEADRQKVNVQKMVLKAAQMHAILAKRNAEKSAKAALRMHDAATRYQLAASDAVSQKVAELHNIDSKANMVQTKAVSQILAKDAEQTLKAKTEANEAKAEAKHANAAKAEALASLSKARKKLQSLSKAASAGTAMIGVKLKEELKAQQVQVQQKIQQVKASTATEVEAKVRKEEQEKYSKKWQREKATLETQLSNNTQQVESHASQVVDAAKAAAVSAKSMAQNEAKAARQAETKSKQIADEATTRTNAVKAAAAQQLAQLAKQRQAAIDHFKNFTGSLKELVGEKSSKAEQKIVAKQAMVDAATEEAARAARFAEQQMTEADLQSSQAAINKASAAGAQLQNAIDVMRTVDVRSRGHVSLMAEKSAVAQEKKEKLRLKEDELAKAKEDKIKADVAAKEKASKAKASAQESKQKTVASEKKGKHDVVHDEGFQKGVEHARGVYEKKMQQRAVAAASALATQRALTVEKDAKALLKEADAQSDAGKSSVQQEAHRLVRGAVDQVQAASGDASDAVDDASQELKSFMTKNVPPPPDAEPQKTTLGVETAAAGAGQLGEDDARKELQKAEKATPAAPVTVPAQQAAAELNTAVSSVAGSSDPDKAAAAAVQKLMKSP